MNDTMQFISEIVQEGCPPGTPELDDPDKTFIDYGMDSLDISGILLACEERFDVKIPDEDMDELTTPRGLAAYLDRVRGA